MSFLLYSVYLYGSEACVKNLKAKYKSELKDLSVILSHFLDRPEVLNCIYR